MPAGIRLCGKGLKQKRIRVDVLDFETVAEVAVSFDVYGLYTRNMGIFGGFRTHDGGFWGL